MRTGKSAAEIWQEYKKAVLYNRKIDLYDTVEKNENFYIGRQWEGLNAPDLAKPVINVLRRVVSHFISMIVADDVAVSFTPFLSSEDMRRRAEIWANEVEKVNELAGIKEKSREVIRNAAVDGDGYLYFYFDSEAETGQLAKGRIACEIIENTSVLFGNPYSADIQKQPYILIEMRKSIEEVREEAVAYGMNDSEAAEIVPDSDFNMYDISRTNGGDESVTVVLRLWKENGTVHAIKSTQNMIIRNEWDTGYTRYPLSGMRWEKVKNSYHGVAALTGLIPNQISINQLFAMAIHSVKMNAFPKTVYDATKISSWSNKVGQAIGVIGNPNDVVVSSFRGADMSGQVLALIDNLIQYTLEYMGASDAALGNIDPRNTSAIIATQKASSMPLELQKLEFFRFTEDYVKTIVDMIGVDYGLREVQSGAEEEAETTLFDFSEDKASGFMLKVDVGSAAYWSEIMQVQTMDNLFEKGIVSDVITYLEGIPEQYLKNKGKIIAKIKNERGLQEGVQQDGLPPMQNVQPGAIGQTMPVM